MQGESQHPKPHEARPYAVVGSNEHTPRPQKSRRLRSHGRVRTCTVEGRSTATPTTRQTVDTSSDNDLTANTPRRTPTLRILAARCNNMVCPATAGTPNIRRNHRPMRNHTWEA